MVARVWSLMRCVETRVGPEPSGKFRAASVCTLRLGVLRLLTSGCIWTPSHGPRWETGSLAKLTGSPLLPPSQPLYLTASVFLYVQWGLVGNIALPPLSGA